MKIMKYILSLLKKKQVKPTTLKEQSALRRKGRIIVLPPMDFSEYYED